MSFVSRSILCTSVLALSWSVPVRADILNPAAVPVDAVEQQEFTGALATFTDTNPSDTAATFVATINWGDGTTTSGIVTDLSGSVAISGDHTYADEGGFTTSVEVTNSSDGSKFTVVGSAASAEADVILATGLTFLVMPGQVFSGPVGTFTDTNLLRTAADFTATIDWGDGTMTTGIVTDFLGSIDVSGLHTYQSPGQFTVTAELGLGSSSDPDTDSATAISTANVPSTVPEPATIAMLGLGLAALLLKRRSLR